MSGNTTYGGYHISLEGHMKAYDRLPARAREVLRNALYDFACPPIAKALRENPQLGDQQRFISWIADNDVVAAREDIAREWGLLA